MQGCDASILLDGPHTEKTAPQNAGLGAFIIIDKIKTVLEDRCPGIVSCSDILNLAARDALHLVRTNPLNSFSVYVHTLQKISLLTTNFFQYFGFENFYDDPFLTKQHKNDFLQSNFLC